MRKLAIAVVLIGIGVVIGLYLRAYRVINHPQIHPLQDGDPPVTVSDGSLHGHSKENGWQRADNGGHTIRPNGANGASGDVQPGCDLPTNSSKNRSATFTFRDGTPIDISPTMGKDWSVTLAYTDAQGNPQHVDETIDFDGLVINDSVGYFDPEDPNDTTNPHDRRHHSDPQITNITVVGGKNPVNQPVQPHDGFKIKVCYL